jgi:hypothetical protein
MMMMIATVLIAVNIGATSDALAPQVTRRQGFRSAIAQ